MTEFYGTLVVPVRAWNNVRKGTWGLPPTVKRERRHMTYNVSVWRKTQLIKKKQKTKHDKITVHEYVYL
jgi:hypothetical protein